MHQQLLEFWFSEDVSKRWYKSTAEFDQLLVDKYQQLWQQATEGGLDHWGETAEGSLALVILLDQLPLNMFRGQPDSFASEAQSREVARAAIAKGFDQELSGVQKSFLFMPFMHSENVADQEYSVKLFSQPGLEGNHRFALHHQAIVKKYGRFPHRNAILGRSSSREEIAYLNSKEAFTG